MACAYSERGAVAGVVHPRLPGDAGIPPNKQNRLAGDPGESAQLKFAPNEDVFPQLPGFGWKRAFSPVVRLSVVDGDTSGGATGYEDMDLTTLAWGVHEGHKLAAPVLELDHNANRFVGGRWIFVACEPDADFFSNTKAAGDAG